MNEKKVIKVLESDKKIKSLCKERGWNINELTTGQMLFIMSKVSGKKLN